MDHNKFSGIISSSVSSLINNSLHLANSVCLRMPKLRVSFLLISKSKSFTIFSKSRIDKFKDLNYDLQYFSSFYKAEWQYRVWFCDSLS